MDAVVLSCIASYAQGMELLRIASADNNYNLHMPSIAQIWKGGCIIRAKLLKRIQDAFNADPQLPNLMIDPWFADQVNRRLPGLAKVVAASAANGIPVPTFSSTLDTSTATAPGVCPKPGAGHAGCFGSHTYQRVDREAPSTPSGCSEPVRADPAGRSRQPGQTGCRDDRPGHRPDLAEQDRVQLPYPVARHRKPPIGCWARNIWPGTGLIC